MLDDVWSSFSNNADARAADAVAASRPPAAPSAGAGVSAAGGLLGQAPARGAVAQLLRGHSRGRSFSRAAPPDLERVSEISHSRTGSWSGRTG